MNPFRSREYFITIKEYSTLSLSRKCHLLPFLLGLFVRLSFHSVQPFSVSFFTQSSTLFFFHCERVPPLSPIHPSHRVVNATCRKDIKWLGEYWHSSGTLIWRTLPLFLSLFLSPLHKYQARSISFSISLFHSFFTLFLFLLWLSEAIFCDRWRLLFLFVFKMFNGLIRSILSLAHRAHFHQVGSLQCYQIGRFIGPWATFQSLWQRLFCPNLPHS